MTMEIEINKVAQDTQHVVKGSVAASTDAWKSMQERMDVSGKAREFVQKATGTAKERAADMHASAEKVTSAVESALVGSIGEAAKFNRAVQEAIYQDAQAMFAGFDKLASAKSFGEAFQIHSDYWRERAEVAASRTKATSDYVGKLMADGAKTVQDNVAKVVPFDRKAA